MSIQERVSGIAAYQGVRYVRPVAPRSARGLVADVYAQIEQEYGAVAPPFGLHSPSPANLAGGWAIVRETLVAKGVVSRRAKEAVAAAVSRTNECPYCEDVHTTYLHAFAERKLAEAIVEGHTDRTGASELRDLASWAMATRSPRNEVLEDPPFSREEAPEIVGVAVAYHYLNRMVNVFLDESPFPARLRRFKGVLKRLVGPLLGSKLGESALPGKSLEFLPAVELPQDLGWAASNPAIAGAFARAAAVIEPAGQRVPPEEVRALVQERARAWDGSDPGLSRRWVEDAMHELPEASKPAARLALLTALASYRVDETTISDFRLLHPGDDALIAATAWSSFTAARKVEAWLHLPAAPLKHDAGIS